MSFNEIDDTLVAYFKQMLGEEDILGADEQSAPENTESSAHIKETASTASHEDTIDYASDDYNPAEDKNIHPQLQPKLEEKVEETTSLPYAEHSSLQSLLEKVDTKTHVATVQAVQTEQKVETAVETAEQTEVATQVATDVETQVDTQVHDTTVDEKSVEEATQSETEHSPITEWENISMPNEFQALFFLVKGIRFAVPLVNLGGIFQCDKVTPLFGKPQWFQGIADIRGKKMNVVDTLKWVKNDAPVADKYEYMIALDKTLWSIGCDELEGNRILSKESVTWRQTAGNRPWLAGIVKKEMCALLHVEALIEMFENGVNLKDLDIQMSA